MRARLTLRIDEIKLFFNTLCDMEITGSKAVIYFIDEYSGIRFRTTLAVSPEKIFVLRQEIADNGQKLDESMYIISDESIRTKRVSVEINNYTIFLFSEGMQVDVADHAARAEIKCFMSLDEKRTEEYRLKFECLGID